MPIAPAGCIASGCVVSGGENRVADKRVKERTGWDYCCMSLDAVMDVVGCGWMSLDVVVE